MRKIKSNALGPLRREWRWAALLFAISLYVYALFWSGHQYSIDGVVMFQYAKALAFQHSFVMSPPVRWGDDIYVSRWAIGLTLIYVPILLVLSKTIFAGDASFTQIPYDPNSLYNSQLLANLPYQYCSFVNPIVTAVTVALLYLMSFQVGLSRRRSVAVALVYGLVSPATVYAKFDFAQPLAALFLLLVRHSKPSFDPKIAVARPSKHSPRQGYGHNAELTVSRLQNTKQGALVHCLPGLRCRL